MKKIDKNAVKVEAFYTLMKSDYEIRRELYLLSLPLMWCLIIWVTIKKQVFKLIGIKLRTNVSLFDGLCAVCRKIKEKAKSWEALEIIYNWHFGKEKNVIGRLTDFWLGMINAQAVRNRLKLVYKELLKAVEEIGQNSKEMQIFSIASGSARAVIGVIAKMSRLKVYACLFDLDKGAIACSQKIAQEFKVEDRIFFKRGSFRKIENIFKEKIFYIVEMIGLLDYLNDDEAVLLIKKIHTFLPIGGKFLIANICPNPEQVFMKVVIDWDMIYRTPKELRLLIEKGGFQEIKIICEPLGLHTLAICTKTNKLISP